MSYGYIGLLGILIYGIILGTVGVCYIKYDKARHK